MNLIYMKLTTLIEANHQFILYWHNKLIHQNDIRGSAMIQQQVKCLWH